jgi:hypothetical protein
MAVATCAPDEMDRSEGPGDGFAWRVAARVALVAFVAFALVLENGFVDWDDQDNFLSNADYRGFGPDQIRWAWTTMRLGVYQPVAWMLLELEYLTSGLDPRGYHLTSLFLHAVNAVVLFGLTAVLLGRCGAGDRGTRLAMAGLATALFAAHPLRAEVVAWASCQPYLPCALFAMLSVLAYLRAHEPGRPRRAWLIGSFVLMATAMLSKAAALTMPAVLIILDVYPLRRLGGGPGRWWGREARRVWAEKIPFLALCPLVLGVAMLSKHEDANLVPVGEAGLLSRLSQACYASCFYPIKTIAPFDLNPYRMRPRPLVWSEPRFVLAMAAVIAMSAVLYRLRARHPAWLATWAAYLVLLLPTSGLVTYGGQLVADRYSYLTTIPGFILAAAGLCRLVEGGARTRAVGRRVVALGVAAGAGLVVLSWDQSRAWHDSVTLWEFSVAHGAGDIADLHNNLGTVLAAVGELDGAVAELDRALRLRPDYPEAHLNRGRALVRLGRIDEAEAEFVEALRLHPALDEARRGLDSARRARRRPVSHRGGSDRPS